MLSAIYKSANAGLPFVNTVRHYHLKFLTVLDIIVITVILIEGVNLMLNKAYLEITNVCNLSCTFCHKTKRKPRLMTADEFEHLASKLKGKIKYLYFHLMGEPTLHPDLPKFISTAKSMGFLPIITTNGTLLGEIRDNILSDPPHKISISLHAPSANKAFADSSYLDNCIDFARQASNAGCYIAYRLWNIGTEEEKENRPILDRLHEEFPGEWTDVRNKNGKKLADRIYLEFAEHFDWPDMNADECKKDADMFCYGLRDQIGILCDGTVVPCCLDAEGVIALGNLFESDLDQIISSPRAKDIYDSFSNRRAAEELCRKCGYAKRFSK